MGILERVLTLQSPTDTKTFYIPATPSTSGLDQISINIAASGDPEVVQAVTLVDDGMGS